MFLPAEHGLHNWLNTRPGGKDDITSMSRTDSNDTSTYLIDQSVRAYTKTNNCELILTYLLCVCVPANVYRLPGTIFAENPLVFIQRPYRLSPDERVHSHVAQPQCHIFVEFH